MLTKVTSLADFFRKVETDERYKTAGIVAYNESQYTSSTSWNDAKSWLHRWAESYVGERKRYKDCKAMVEYLNRYIH